MPRKRFEGLGVSGLNTDVPPGMLPPEAWTKLDHCTTMDGSLTAATGESYLVLLSADPIYNYVFTDFTGAVFLIYSNGGVVYAVDSSKVTRIISPTTWPAGVISFATLNGILLVNNTSLGPHYWPGGTDKLTLLPGWDTKWTCTAIAAYRYYIVAMGMREDALDFPHKVRWSNSAQAGAMPTQWVPALDNDAGADVLGETPGTITGAATVQNSLWIVKTDGIYSMDWVGGDFIMQFRRLEGSIGTRLAKGFVPMGQGMAVLTNRDLVLYEGGAQKSLVDMRVRNAMFGSVNQESRELSSLFYASGVRQLMVSYRPAEGTTGAGPHTATLIYDLQEGSWTHRRSDGFRGYGEGVRDYRIGTSLTWDGLGSAAATAMDLGPAPTWVKGAAWDQQPVASTWGSGIVTPSTPDLFTFCSRGTDYAIGVVDRSGFSIWGAPMASIAERIGIRLEGSDGLSRVVEVWPEITVRSPNVSVTFEVGCQDHPTGVVTWSNKFTITPNLGQTPAQIGPPPEYADSITPRLTGRYMAWRVSSSPTGAVNTENTQPNQWALSAITVQWERDGER